MVPMEEDISRYHARWNGPFIGFDLDYRFGCGCEADWDCLVLTSSIWRLIMRKRVGIYAEICLMVFIIVRRMLWSYIRHWY